MFEFIKRQWKKFLILIGLTTAVCLGAELLPDKISEHLKLKCDKADIIFSKEIENNVSYLYNSKKEVKATKYKGLYEDITKRTKNAQFFNKSKTETIGNFFAGEPFYKKNDKWFQTETATTTKNEFVKQTKISLLDRIFKNEVLADSASYFSGTGDGSVYYSHASWDTAHDATTGAGVLSATTLQIRSDTGYPMGGSDNFYRSFFPINTSELPDDASISAALFKLYIESVTDTDDDGNDYIAVLQTDQPSTSELTTADYNNCGATNNPTEGSDQLDVSSGITTSAYNTWTLNATGRGWISLTGWTKLGMREGHDIVDDPITGNNIVQVEGRSSDYADTTYDPYIEITYTAGAPEADTCNYSGSGDWDVLYSDNCYATTTTYVLGDFNLIYDGVGSFNLQTILKCDNLNVGAGATISAENSTAQIEIY